MPKIKNIQFYTKYYIIWNLNIMKITITITLAGLQMVIVISFLWVEVRSDFVNIDYHLKQTMNSWLDFEIQNFLDYEDY